MEENVTPTIDDKASIHKIEAFSKCLSKTNSKYDNFDPESVLHSLGYKVGKTGLSKSRRRELLKTVIESDELSKSQVINVINCNISMFKN